MSLAEMQPRELVKVLGKKRISPAKEPTEKGYEHSSQTSMGYKERQDRRR